GETIVDVPPRTVAHEGPVYERPYARPDWQDALQADVPDKLPRPQDGAALRDAVLRVVASPNHADKSWVTDQYDRYVRGNTALAQPEDAGIVRVDESTDLGVALATDCNGRYAKLDPYAGAQLALCEAYRNVAVTGATPLAVTDCLNFGSPEDPAVMWQFERATQGLKDACAELGVPVTGGNVSFYNQTGDVAILPTPVVGVLGVIDDVKGRAKQGFKLAGHVVYLLGETRDELGGSAWAGVVHDHLGGTPPVVDLAAERALAGFLVEAAKSKNVSATHDLSDGGLAVALVEASLRNGVGVRVELPEGADPFMTLFSESVARAIVAVAPERVEAFDEVAGRHGVPAQRIGVVGGDAIVVEGQFELPIPEVGAVWAATLPSVLDD
ncbi:MAG: AIR synthase related protein, partial [Nocardioidaceae bacterium]